VLFPVLSSRFRQLGQRAEVTNGRSTGERNQTRALFLPPADTAPTRFPDRKYDPCPAHFRARCIAEAAWLCEVTRAGGVQFKFASLPSATSVTVYWKTPDGQKVATVVKPVTPIVVSDVGSASPLPKGTWQAVIEARGKVLRHATVQLS
jgi:hypothetical protein